MDDKKQLLRQIGWSDELIEACLSPDNRPPLELPQLEYQALVPSQQDVTNFVVTIRTPTISDGSNL
jgi:hypothetical protein